jgi:Tfp pilus assembly pilus retraction ATPase PilT
MTNWKASEVRLEPGSPLQVQIDDTWRKTGSRRLTIDDVRGLTVSLLGEDLANIVVSGKDVQTRREIPGHGSFIVRARDREGSASLSIIPAAAPATPEAE